MSDKPSHKLKSRAGIWCLFGLLVLFFSPSRLHAEEMLPGCLPSTQNKTTIVEVLSSQTFKTAKGLIIKLAGMEAPGLDVASKRKKNTAIARRALKFLTKLVLNKQVVLVLDTNKLDRHGRRIAHAFVLSPRKRAPTWVQAAMIERGMARAFPNTTTARCINELLKVERLARLNKTGLWKNRFYQITRSDDLKHLNRSLGRFHLIEGRVHSVSVRRSRSYINFSKNWRRDFTVTINRRVHKLFTKSGVNIKELKGKYIRVRGWLGRHNGPTIEAYHVAQIEILKK